jgi:hypothetical protein
MRVRQSAFSRPLPWRYGQLDTAAEPSVSQVASEGARLREMGGGAWPGYQGSVMASILSDIMPSSDSVPDFSVGAMVAVESRPEAQNKESLDAQSSNGNGSLLLYKSQLGTQDGSCTHAGVFCGALFSLPLFWVYRTLDLPKLSHSFVQFDGRTLWNGTFCGTEAPYLTRGLSNQVTFCW